VVDGGGRLCPAVLDYFASSLLDRIEPAGQGAIEDTFGTRHIQTIFFRDEGKVGDKDIIPPGHEGADVARGRLEHGQKRKDMVEKGLAALYFDTLNGEIVRIESDAPESAIWRKIPGADAVTFEKVIGGNHGQVDG